MKEGDPAGPPALFISGPRRGWNVSGYSLPEDTIHPQYHPATNSSPLKGRFIYFCKGRNRTFFVSNDILYTYEKNS